MPLRSRTRWPRCSAFPPTAWSRTPGSTGRSSIGCRDGSRGPWPPCEHCTHCAGCMPMACSPPRPIPVSRSCPSSRQPGMARTGEPVSTTSRRCWRPRRRAGRRRTTHEAIRPCSTRRSPWETRGFLGRSSAPGLPTALASRRACSCRCSACWKARWTGRCCARPASTSSATARRFRCAPGCTCSNRPAWRKSAPRGFGGIARASAPTPLRCAGRMASGTTLYRHRSCGTGTTSPGSAVRCWDRC